jgi:murein DD-endopeptidase MepM/ murein hydrolase activator NlpD
MRGLNRPIARRAGRRGVSGWAYALLAIVPVAAGLAWSGLVPLSVPRDSAGEETDAGPQLRAYPMPLVISQPLEAMGTAVREQAEAFGTMIEDSAPARLVRTTLSIGRGDTLMKVLTKAGADNQESAEAIRALNPLFDPRKLQLGQEITVTFEKDDEKMRLAALDVVDSVQRTVSVTRDTTGFSAQEVLREFDRTMVRAAGIINTSLYQTAMDAGLPMPVLAETIRLFSYDVDFQREVQPGDSFEVYFERFADEDGKPVMSGAILSASMTLSGHELRYYRHAPKGEEVDYFTAAGKSVRKALLRTPIDGARLTSGFGPRNHPVLGYSKMHRGVDFGAAAGTPIQAAGDGTVEKAGWSGGYGNYIRLRHNNQYSTAYGHMSRMAVKAGQRVRQGQIIGYVGSTGMSTGPHLHYETIYNGQQINPLSVRLPTGRSLEGRDLAAFRNAVEEIDRAMDRLPRQFWLTAQGQ